LLLILSKTSVFTKESGARTPPYQTLYIILNHSLSKLLTCT